MTLSNDLVEALRSVNQDGAIAVLSHAPQLINEQINDLSGNGRRYYPIHVAAFTSQAKLLRHLIEMGCDINIVESTHKGWIALHFAAQHRNAEIAMILMEHNVNTSIKDADGKTALDFAHESAHDDIADIISGTPLNC